MTFGDHEAADSYDTAAADHVQVARKLRALYDAGLDDVTVALRLLAWLRRGGMAR